MTAAGEGVRFVPDQDKRPYISWNEHIMQLRGGAPYWVTDAKGAPVRSGQPKLEPLLRTTLSTFHGIDSSRSRSHGEKTCR